MDPSYNNILNKIVNLYNSFPSKSTSEAGDGLSTEMTTLVFDRLSPLDWVKSCELVCWKWKIITTQARLWKGLAQQFKISFDFQPNQPITPEIKKQICTCLEGHVSSKEEFEKYIKKICHSVALDQGQILALSYKSDSDPNVILRIYITKHTDSYKQEIKGLGFHEEQMKRANYFYSIEGKDLADFSWQAQRNRNGISTHKHDMNDVPIIWEVATDRFTRKTKSGMDEEHVIHYSSSRNLLFTSLTYFIELIVDELQEADRRKEG